MAQNLKGEKETCVTIIDQYSRYIFPILPLSLRPPKYLNI